MKVELVVTVEMTDDQVKAYADQHTGGDVSRVGSDVADWVWEAIEVSKLHGSGLVESFGFRKV